MDEATDLRGADALGRGVDRYDAAGVDLIAASLQWLAERVRDHELPAVPIQTACDHETLTGHERLRAKGLVPPDEGERAGLVFDGDGQQMPLRSNVAAVHSRDGALRRCLLPDLEIPDLLRR